MYLCTRMKPTTYSMKELSAMYFPHSSIRSAGVQLKRWFVYNKPLMQALTDAGYYNGQKILTPKQVTLVFDYLGEP
ncbi:DUF4248 domain-containing protein [Parabacteroides gordonii]|nr:DUF4248 domain-containing protein [Parabacteroides gordonii]MCA5584920.1 DUF4248 domain-containing protein [Parabacteroides gordonii]